MGVEVILLGVACGLLLVLALAFIEFIFKQNGYEKSKVEGTSSLIPNKINYQHQPQYGLNNVGKKMKESATSALVGFNGQITDKNTENFENKVFGINNAKKARNGIKPFDKTEKWWNGLQ